jgi:hypothetical protein
MNQASNDDLFTTPDAERYLGFSYGYLGGLRYKNKGPNYIKKGRLCLYSKSELDAWLRSKGPKYSRPHERGIKDTCNKELLAALEQCAQYLGDISAVLSDMHKLKEEA